MIWVQNNAKASFSGRYDGVDYEFAQGKAVALSELAAAHIFGYGLDDDGKRRCLARYGLLKTAADLKSAMEWLAQFTFAEAGVPQPPDLSPAVHASVEVGAEAETESA